MRPSSPAAPRRHPRRWLKVVAVGAALVAPTLPSATAGASPDGLRVTVTSSVGPVLRAGSCRVSGTGSSVVATGAVAHPPRGRVTVTLDVYGAQGSPLDLEGAGHSSTLTPGATRWRVRATIVRGFSPTTCAIHVGAAESLERIVVQGTSMAPTLAKGSSVVVDLSAYASARPVAGDLVAVRAPAGAACAGPGRPELVLRVVALGGQTVEGAKGAVVVNGAPLAQTWLPKKVSSKTPPFAAVRVPAGSVFLLGDNRAAACDSRNFGAVAAADVMGKVVKILPPEHATSTPSTYSSKETTPAVTT